ncbi:MAG: hypothetical protein LC676_10805 [Loktanella sp.]|nr:hypothetical protein [Loktanella sp.]
MTNTTMITRIAAALRAGDVMDLDAMASMVHDLLIDETERAAWLDMIEASMEAIDLQS